MRKKISIYTILSIVLGVFTSAFILSFISVFWGRPLPNELGKWGDFGSYAAFISSMLNLILFVILTYKASEFEKKTYENQNMLQKATFNQQMLAQKVELQTDFRKGYIDDIRKRLFELNNLTYYKIDDVDDFKKFKRECESLARIFKIYEENRNKEIVGACSYCDVNECLRELLEINASFSGKSVMNIEQQKIIWEKLNNANRELIKLEKELADYAILELENVFKNDIQDL